MKPLLTLIGLFCISTVLGQIKIGDNPQNLDANSVLELESTNRVLVITRIDSEQMNGLAPLPGALVYNTDTQCVHFFDGAAWLNLCDALGLSLTADPLVNPTSTIVITQTGSNYNFEVGEIRGTNIADFSISGIDIQNNSITDDKLAPDSVGSEELRDNTVADAEIDYNQVTLADFLNDVGYITAVDIVSGAAGNSIIDNAGAFYDDTPLQNAIAANTAAIAADGDSDSTNEIQVLSLTGTDLTISGSNTVDLSGFSDSGTDDQNLTGASLSPANVLQIDIEDGTSAIVDLSPLSGTGTDDQDLTGASLSPANVLQIDIEDGTPAIVDLSPLAGTGTDEQDLTGASLSPANILQIDIENGASTQVDLSALDDPGTDDQDLTGASLSPANVLQIDIENGASATVDLSTLAGAGTDDQEAFEVPFTPAGNTASADVQAAIEELQTEIDGISAGGAANPTDELITSFTLTGTDLNIAEGANIPPPVDLSSLVDDADADPANELQNLTSGDGSVIITPAGNDFDLSVPLGSDDQNLTAATLVGTDLTIDIEDGLSATADLSALATDAELAALPVDDADADPTNEIQTISSTDGSVTLVQTGDDYDLSVAGGSDDQNLTAATLVGTDLTIDIEDGLSATADLSALATDAELAALPVDDADADPTNEIQTITSTDGSVTLVQTGDDYDLSVAGGTDDQNLTAATLVGTDLTIDIEDGLSATADLSALATDAELAALPIDDADADPTNEIQTITSTDGSVTLVQTGDDYDLSVAGGSTDDQNLTAATLVGTDLTIDIEDGLSATADLSALATDAELAALPVDDADADPTNEIQTITSTDGSVTLVQTGDDYDLSVAGGSTDDQNLTAATLVGTDLTIDIEDGLSATADLSALATDAELAALPIDDADADPTNEIQTITSTDGSVTLVQTGDDYDLSVASGGTVSVDATLTGDGSVGNPLGVATAGITATQIAPGAITGGAGGSIADNTITASDLDADSVDSSEIRIDAVGASEIQTGAVTTDEILNLTILNEDISATAAIDGTKIDPDFGAQGIVTTLGLSVGADILLNGNAIIPDYVFETYYLGSSNLNAEYGFQSLEEIEAFVKKNHHLPGIKSNEDVAKDGFWNLTESNLRNLEKIEELFLHTIEQQKQIKALEKENEELSDEVRKLRQEMEAIKTMLKQ